MAYEYDLFIIYKINIDMEKYIKYILLLFCFFSCESEEEEQYKLYIINNSNETIVSAYSRYLPNGFCIKGRSMGTPIKRYCS